MTITCKRCLARLASRTSASLSFSAEYTDDHHQPAGNRARDGMGHAMVHCSDGRYALCVLTPINKGAAS